MSPPEPGGSSRRDELSLGYANYVLALLFVVYVFNFLDRQILTILLDPIKADLGVSDSAMGFLTGFAFALFYTVAGIPIARWADRGTRRTIIAIGLAVWSAMTAFSGLARTFLHLAAARIGVGIGEAACSPPAHSLLSDYFPPERRATALSIYSSGIYVGSMCGYLAGGWINELFSWRVAFLVVGVPGVLLALVVRFTVREPERGRSEAAPVAAEDDRLGDVVRFLLRRRTFVLAGLACGMTAFSSYAYGVWSPAFLGRVHGMGSGEIGTWLGLIAGAAGGAGAALSGWIADRLAVRDPRWYLWLPALSTGLAIPLAIPYLFLDDARLALGFYTLSNLFSAMFLGPTLAALYSLVKLRMRALTSAVLFFILNLIGLGAGPQAVGVLNDLLDARYGAEAVRYSLLIVSLIALSSVVLYLLAARNFAADRARAGEAIA